MAGSVITILPVLILYLLVQRQFTEGIATTGLKG
jgi:ABC-type glycerol-3-phosphate transport system permease component